MATVLIADIPEACSTLQGILAPAFDVRCVSTFDDFRTTVSTRCDEISLVVCGCHFDEGRMYDALRLLRSNFWPRLPFLAIRTLQGELDDAVYEGVRIATRALDGDAFVDFLRWKRKYGPSKSEQKLVALIRERIQGGDDLATQVGTI